MVIMKLERSKGTRDFLPEEQIARSYAVDTLKEGFELYGYSPMETPSLERFDVLSSKYTGGAEILKETFKLKDQGGRELGLRYDLTVSFARVIGINPQLKMPFKRYEIGNVWRDGPVGLARYRQFLQCDVDIVGSSSMLADAELIALTDAAFKKLGFDAVIKVNNRKILNDILSYLKIKKEKLDNVMLSIDKLEKFGIDTVKKELKDKKIDKKIIDKLLRIIAVKGADGKKISELKKIIKNSDGLKEMEELLGYLKILNINVEFDVSLSRGLSYYTGPVFEVYLKNSDVKSSVCAGGRYDKMIGALLGKGDYPATGISFGLDRLYDAYIEKKKTKQKTVTKAYIIPIGMLNEALKTAQKLRDNNIKVDIDLMQRGVSKNLNYANSMRIPYVIFIGEDEVKQGKVKLRDMGTGEEKLISIDEVVRILR